MIASPRGWSVLTQCSGDVLAVETGNDALRLVLLGRVDGFDGAETEAWLNELLGVAGEEALGDTAPDPCEGLPPLLHRALSGLLFYQAELWGRAGTRAPCTIALATVHDAVALGWVGEPGFATAAGGFPHPLTVRDADGREAHALVLDRASALEITAAWEDADGRAEATIAWVPDTAAEVEPAPLVAEIDDASPELPEVTVSALDEGGVVEPAPATAERPERAPRAMGELADPVVERAEQPDWEREDEAPRRRERKSWHFRGWLDRLRGGRPARRADETSELGEPASEVKAAEADEAAPAEAWLLETGEATADTTPEPVVVTALDEPGQAIAEDAPASVLARSGLPELEPHPELWRQADLESDIVPVDVDLDAVVPPTPEDPALAEAAAPIVFEFPGLEEALAHLETFESARPDERMPPVASEAAVTPEDSDVPAGVELAAVELAAADEDVAAHAPMEAAEATTARQTPIVEPEEDEFALALAAEAEPTPEPGPERADPFALALADAPATAPRAAAATPGVEAATEPDAAPEPQTIDTFEPLYVPASDEVPDLAPSPAPVREPEAVAHSGPQAATVAPRRVRRLELPPEEEAAPPQRRRYVVAWSGLVIALFVVGWVVGGIRTDDPVAGRTTFAARMFAAVGFAPPTFVTEVTSRPDGAWISIDGRDLARRTPATVALAPGAHTIALAFPDLGGVSVDVRGGRGDRRKVEGVLWGALAISAGTSAPVHVTVDGVERGTAPVTLENVMPGIHQVAFSGPGLAPWERTIEVRVHQRAQLVAEPTLSPARGQLEVRATMTAASGAQPISGATVWIDGVHRGVTPLHLDLPRGPHSVRVSWHGEEPPVQVIDLPGGNERYATFELGASVIHPRLVLAPSTGKVPMDRASVVSATLEGVRPADMREMWLHVGTPEGAWRRYPMSTLPAPGGVVGVSVFPVALFDTHGSAPFYVSATLASGDEYFTELQTASAR